MYVVLTIRRIKIFIEYVGANMSVQVPLLVIDRIGVSVMSMITHKYRGSQQFLRVEYSTQIY